MTAADDRVDRLTKSLEASIAGWRFEPVVGALQALRGVAAITAIGLVAEIGDLGRFTHPRKLWGIWDWFHLSVPAASARAEAASPRQATRTHGDF